MPSDNFDIITSDHLLHYTDHPFKVFAGPGAGKTHWLINNIKNIINNSKKLNLASKIACITYTNVAVEEILTRLNMTGDRVEISTIHSFLYKCLVKPYAFLLRYPDGRGLINVENLDGHDDHIPSIGRILGNKTMSAAILRNRMTNNELKEVLSALEWSIVDDNIVLQPCKSWLKRKYRNLINTSFFFDYKTMFWEEGIIHHEDVLFFAHEILKNHPLLREFIAQKYTHILVDEFQDTHPVQTKILRWLSEAGAVIGVIGDPAQSIFKFQGASRNDFIDFTLPEQQIFTMKQNRRSTRNIVNVLNHIRGDDEVFQECQRDIDGCEVCVIVDKKVETIMSKYSDERIRKELTGTSCIVSRKNDSVIRLKSSTGNCNLAIWNDFSKADNRRQRFVEILLSAQEYANRSMYETAINSAIKLFKADKDGSVREPFIKCTHGVDNLWKRSMAVSLLEYLLSNRESTLGKNLLSFYSDLITYFGGMGLSLKRVSAGEFKSFAQSVSVNDLVIGLKLGEEKNSSIRTIHKSKGAEFQSVLVYFDDSNDLKHIVHPDIQSEEDDSRLYYVALSRAEDLLCIATHELRKDIADELTKLNIRVIA